MGKSYDVRRNGILVQNQLSSPLFFLPFQPILFQLLILRKTFHQGHPMGTLEFRQMILTILPVMLSPDFLLVYSVSAANPQKQFQQEPPVKYIGLEFRQMDLAILPVMLSSNLLLVLQQPACRSPAHTNSIHWGFHFLQPGSPQLCPKAPFSLPCSSPFLHVPCLPYLQQHFFRNPTFAQDLDSNQRMEDPPNRDSCSSIFIDAVFIISRN